MIASATTALLLVAASGGSDEWQWRAALGAHIEPQTHGVFDLGLKKDELSIELLTDTLDIRWAAKRPQGHWWAAARGEALIAGLMSTPYRAGAPAPDRGLFASYVGAEAGGVLHLPAGLWAGLDGAAKVFFFGATSTTKIPVPPTARLFTAAAQLGWWSPWLNLRVRAGADLRDDTVAPFARLVGALEPKWWLAPHVKVHAGISDGQDAITQTRVGGLSPYAVPVAGSGWAEWWVDDYAAVRAGPRVSWSSGHATVFGDLVFFDRQRAEGIGVEARQTYGAWFAEVAAGYAPRIPRAPGVGRFGAWLRVGRQWAPF